VFLDQRGDAFETDRAGPLKVDEPSTSVRRSGCCSTFRRVEERLAVLAV